MRKIVSYKIERRCAPIYADILDVSAIHHSIDSFTNSASISAKEGRTN